MANEQRKFKKGFKLPVIIDDVPVEVENKINEDVNRDNAYLNAKEVSKNRKWSSLNSNFRKVGDFLSDYFSRHFADDVSYEFIAEQLGMNEATVRSIINELASWKQYPFTIIATPGKKGFIQLSTKSLENTESWLRKKARSLATGQARYDKTETSIEGKRLTEKRKQRKMKVKA